MSISDRTLDSVVGHTWRLERERCALICENLAANVCGDWKVRQALKRAARVIRNGVPREQQK